jgi:hypothetical protein
MKKLIPLLCILVLLVFLGTSCMSTDPYMQDMSTRNIYPAVADTYNLGSSEFPYHSIYVGNSTIYVGGVPITQLEGNGGPPGTKWYSDTGEPTSELGVDGDWYLNSASSEVYEKTDVLGSPAWTLRGSLSGMMGPQGDPGPPGNNTPIKGVDYFDGAPGAPGQNGTNGQDGAPGAKGDQGTQGTQGIQGYTGETGPQGTPGNNGTTPVKGVDYFDGTNGTNGQDGYTPIKGTDYFDGEDGYTPIKGTDYFDGTDGADGSQGLQGIQGIQGIQGTQGNTGGNGTNGIDGTNGTSGEDGYTPIKNVDYFDGAEGAKGDKGDQGDPGPTHTNITILDLISAAFTTTLKSSYDAAVGDAHSHSNAVTLNAIQEAFTTALKAAYDTAVTDSHTHSNINTLNAVTAAFTTALKSSYDAAATASHGHSNISTLDAITVAFTTALKTSYDSAVTASHTHSNQSTLDLISAAFTTSLKSSYDSAVTDSHTHNNKSILDAIQESFTTALKSSYDSLVTNFTTAWKTTVDNFIASKGSASGLAPLDASSKVPTVNLGGSGASSSTYLRGDQTWATPAGGGESEIVVILTADRTNSSTSFADITDLTFTPLAGKTYIIEAWLIFQSNTVTTGIGFAGNGPASPTAYVMNANIPIVLTLYASDSLMASRAYNVGTASASVDTINANLLAKIDCLLVNGVNSTAFTLRFKAETTGTVKVLAGSTLRYRQVN